MSIVLALDIGATFTGAAFAFSRTETQNLDRPEIEVCRRWPNKVNEVKVPSALFYRSQDDPDPLWGWKASQESLKGKHESWQYQNRFKNRFIGGMPDSSLPPLPPGKTREDVYQDYLQQVVAFLFHYVNDHLAIDHKQFLWCLIVPSTFPHSSRAAMIEIARKVGIVGEDKPFSSAFPLNMVTEHEALLAAAIHGSSEFTTRLSDGQPFLAVDFGAHNLHADVVSRFGTTVREISSQTRTRGASLPNDLFLDDLASHVPDFGNYRASEKGFANVSRLLEAFESSKRKFAGTENKISIVAPPALRTALPHFAAKGSDEESQIHIPSEAFTSLLSAPVTTVLELVSLQLAQYPTIQNIFVSGGFSQNPYFRRKLNELLQNQHPKIFFLDNPESSVVTGAVLLALRQTCFQTAKAPMTIGIQAALPAEDGDKDVIYDEVSGSNICKTRFTPIIVKDQEINDNSIITLTFQSSNPSEDMTITLYSSNIAKPRHIDEPNVVEYAKVLIPLSKLKIDHKFDLEFLWNAGSLAVVARNAETGEELHPIVIKPVAAAQ